MEWNETGDNQSSGKLNVGELDTPVLKIDGEMISPSTYSDDWHALDAGAAIMYRKTNAGIVHLKVYGVYGNYNETLPEGYRPPHQIVLSGFYKDPPARIEVYSSGQVTASVSGGNTGAMQEFMFSTETTESLGGAKGEKGETGVQGATGPQGADGSGAGETHEIGEPFMYMKDYPNIPALPSNCVEMNGQTLDDSESVFDGQVIPNLNDGRFIKGGSTSNVFEEDTMQIHRHKAKRMGLAFLAGGSSDYVIHAGGGVTEADAMIQDPVSDGEHGDPRVADKTQPECMTVVFCMRIK